MMCDCVSHECAVFSSSRSSAVDPPHSSCAVHTVANYGLVEHGVYHLKLLSPLFSPSLPPPPPRTLSDLEDQWQGKSTLALLGNRLQLPLSGACLLTLRENSTEGGEGEGERKEVLGAITVRQYL